MIDIRHVYQTFGDRHILKDVSLSIKEGETMVILGASGSGREVYQIQQSGKGSGA